MSVIEHDFGLADRLTERRFARLLDLDALHEANIRANPLPYLERASERIFQLQQVLFEAVQTVRAEKAEPSSTREIKVDEAEYLRLKKCFSILEKGFARCGAGEGEL
jgi:hypothetical protein